MLLKYDGRVDRTFTATPMTIARKPAGKPPVIATAARKFLEKLEARQDPLTLPQFIREGWHVLEPATEYQHNWHIDAISDHLTAVTNGQIKKLVICVPPGSMKSLLTCVFWIAWEWGEVDASTRWLFSSYANTLSARDSVKCRRLIQSDWYQSRYGDRFKLVGDQNVKTYFENNKTGFRIATSVGSAGTGFRADRILVDDPHKVTEAESDAIRGSAVEWWQTEMSNRGSSKDAAYVVIQQRVHEEDVAGVCIEAGYERLVIPSEYEGDKHITSIRWSDPRSEHNELMWGDRFDHAYLAGQKKDLGSYGYAGQHLQRPSPSGGGEFKRDWWKFYRRSPSPEDFDQIIQSWDCTFKDAETSDFVVGQVWGKKGADFYLLDQVRDRMGIAATMNAIRSLSAKHPQVHAKLVEDKANGSAVIELMQREIPGLIPVNPRGGKIARARSIAPYVESGNVWLPDPSLASWINDWIEELSVFPVGKHDDQVDCTSMAVAYLATSIRKDQGVGLVRGGRRQGYSAIEGF